MLKKMKIPFFTKNTPPIVEKSKLLMASDSISKESKATVIGITSASVIANDSKKTFISLYQSFSTPSSPVDDDSEGYHSLRQSKKQGDFQIFPDCFTEKYAISGHLVRLCRG